MRARNERATPSASKQAAAARAARQAACAGAYQQQRLAGGHAAQYATPQPSTTRLSLTGTCAGAAAAAGMPGTCPAARCRWEAAAAAWRRAPCCCCCARARARARRRCCASSGSRGRWRHPAPGCQAARQRPAAAAADAVRATPAARQPVYATRSLLLLLVVWRRHLFLVACAALLAPIVSLAAMRTAVRLRRRPSTPAAGACMSCSSRLRHAAACRAADTWPSPPALPLPAVATTRPWPRRIWRRIMQLMIGSGTCGGIVQHDAASSC